MAHWNDWLTDRSVRLTDIQRFMGNIDNIGRKWNGKYLIYTISGSTGNPLISLCECACTYTAGYYKYYGKMIHHFEPTL